MALAILLFAGCRSAPPPTAFYTLTSVTKAERPVQDTTPMRDLAVGIGPVQIPEYLDRPQIVTRSTPDKVALSEFNRWGGSLRQDFPRVLAENVAALLGTDRVLAYPWGDRLDPAYRVALDVQQFDGDLGGTVVLKATWILTGREGKTPLSVRKSDIREPVSGNDYDALVGAQSRALAALSRQIVGEVRKLAGGAGS
ncbi:MAG: membrane integrity-associated transporter subunit PqiC [Nitrospirota bacterium]